jgi:hypothetical protein
VAERKAPSTGILAASCAICEIFHGISAMPTFPAVVPTPCEFNAHGIQSPSRHGMSHFSSLSGFFPGFSTSQALLLRAKERTHL